MKIPTSDWGTRFNDSETIRNCGGIDLVLIVFKCKIRPDLADFNILAVLIQILACVDPKHVALVFTFADQDDQMDTSYAMEWYEDLRTSEPSLPTMTQDRVFLFKGSDS